MKGLSRDVIVEAGLRLLDDVGLDGLTVRKLAAELGVQSPALYWHLKTKQELIDGMADAIVQGAGMGPPREGESWQEWLRRRARGYRGSLLAHRDGARVVVAGRPAPGALHFFEEELAAMVALGFTPVLAMRTISTLAHYINGFVLQEQAVTGPGDARQLASLPTLTAAVTAGAYPIGDDSFEYGLTTLIEGTAAAL